MEWDEFTRFVVVKAQLHHAQMSIDQLAEYRQGSRQVWKYVSENVNVIKETLQWGGDRYRLLAYAATLVDFSSPVDGTPSLVMVMCWCCPVHLKTPLA